MPFENRDESNPLDQVVIPLHAEEVSIGKKQVATGRVKVSTVAHSREELVQQLLQSERVEIERVPMGQVSQRSLRFAQRVTSPSSPWKKLLYSSGNLC